MSKKKKKRKENKKTTTQNNLKKLEESDELNEAIPEIIENITNTKEIPKEQLGIIEESLTMMSVMQNNAESMIAKKINDKHIDTFLENQKKQMELEYEDNNQQRKFLTVFLIVIAIVFIFVIWLFKDSPTVIGTIIVAIGSSFGGYGIGKNQKNKP